MHDAQTSLARREPAASRLFAAPYGSHPRPHRNAGWRAQCLPNAVLRVSHAFHGTVDVRVLGYDDIPDISRPLKLEFQNKHGDKVIDRFHLDELKSLEVLAWE